jgi:FAD/FMN-containing dehydrogenase
VPTGVCGDVCVAGFMQGGGYGLTSRKFGMNCDNVEHLLVMLASGEIVEAGAGQREDLFWAMRGGTGNNFGVLLQCTYRLHDLVPLWGFGLRWTLAQAPQAMVALQEGFMAGGVSDDLGYMLAFVYEGKTGDPVLVMRGAWWGEREAGLALLRPLMQATGATLQLDRVGPYQELNDWLFETPEPVPNCPDLAREDKQSAIIARRLGLAEWEQVCQLFRKSPTPWNCFVIEPYGGAVNAVPRDFNAFVHRDADLDLFVDVFWMDEAQRVQAQAWLDDCMAVIEAFSNGESYQNYPRLSQTDYRQRYWKEAFPRLLQVKRKYDPHDFFRYAQSVSPEPRADQPR